MIKSILIYRIFSYILLIIAAILGIGVLAGLFIALANPALLLNIFIAAAVVMYSISSFLFLIRGIDGKQQLKPGMKDFIRVNAFVAVYYAVKNISEAIMAFSTKGFFEKTIADLSKLTVASTAPTEFLIIALKIALVFNIVYAVILLVHIAISFRMLKQFAHLFGNSNTTEV